MPYIPNSDDDVKTMLEAIGVSSLDELFSTIPDSLRLTKPLDLPPPLAEPELINHLKQLAARNDPGEVSFIGGGVYNHFIPPVIWNIAMRPEFSTAYTPYQAEVAQGTLQAIYEYQSHICRLTGMDVSNASLYDGATAVAEAAILAVNHTGRERIVVSEAVNPLYREVLKSILSGRHLDIVTLPSSQGVTDYDRLGEFVDDKAACLILGQPNFFGHLVRHGIRSDFAGHSQDSGRVQCRYRSRRRSGIGDSAEFRRSASGVVCRQEGIRAQDSRTAGGADG